MQHNEIPDHRYAETWTGGHVKISFFTRSDGSRLRYFTAGTGPPLVLLPAATSRLWNGRAKWLGSRPISLSYR